MQTKPQGGIIYQTPVPGKNSQETQKPSAGMQAFNGFLNFVRNLVTLLILGALALWLLPRWFGKAVDQTGAKPWQASGYGLITITVGFVGAFLASLVVLLVGIILSLATLGGLSGAWFGIGFSGLAVVFTAFVLLVNYGSKLVVAFFVGRWLLGKIAPQAVHPEIWSLVLGVTLYALLRAIPVLGWLIALVVTLIGMGAMWLVYTNRKNTEVLPEPVQTI
jgi:hypothetical protein